MDLVSPVGEQHQHPLVSQAAGQKRDESSGRSVGPMHVLQDQHQRTGLAHHVDELQQRLEQAHLRSAIVADRRRLAVTQPGQKGRQLPSTARSEPVQRAVALADQRAQGPDQRSVGQLPVGLLHRLPAQHEHRPVGDLPLELRHQPRLADPGFAAQQNQPGLAFGGVVRSAFELPEFPQAPHEVVTCDSRPHLEFRARRAGGLADQHVPMI
jgi:hypothetical protein